MNKTEVKMNKPIYLSMPILDINKTLMYKLWYDYIKPKYGDRTKLCYMDTDSFIIHIKILKIFTKILQMMLKNGLTHLTMMRMIKDCFQSVRTKKVIDLFKDELGGKTMRKFCALRAKT